VKKQPGELAEPAGKAEKRLVSGKRRRVLPKKRHFFLDTRRFLLAKRHVQQETPPVLLVG
jgi:hypothetical protein